MTAKKKTCGGFTIIELMVAMIAFSILALTVGLMLMFGWRAWTRSNDMVAMQRDASLAMMMIAKDIRNSTYADVTAGAGIAFTASGTSYSESGNNLTKSDGTIVVNGWLVPNSFRSQKRFAVDALGHTNSWVSVGFRLQTTDENEVYTIKIQPRN